MPQWFHDISEAQAILLSSIITVGGAVLAVLLGSLLFSGKVKDMKSALEATEGLVKKHQDRVSYSLSDIEEKISSLTSAIAQIRADVSDNQAQEDEDQIDEAATQDAEHELTFENLQTSWFKIRDHLEEIAADARIDGRTAAKYARIDRRRYPDLVVSLDKDSRLGSLGSQYLEAAQLWASHRTRKKTPTQVAISRMVELANLLAADSS